MPRSAAGVSWRSRVVPTQAGLRRARWATRGRAGSKDEEDHALRNGQLRLEEARRQGKARWLDRGRRR
ncbi:hypothetical protein JCM21900_002871 [Sporobolomyces salmonicolor]